MSSTFPIPDLPKDNPLLEERVTLGEKLFNETALSKDNTISCASCHRAENAFTDPVTTALACVNKSAPQRHAALQPAWKSSFLLGWSAAFHGAQALMPIQDHTEMDESLTNGSRNWLQQVGGQPRPPRDTQDSDAHGGHALPTTRTTPRFCRRIWLTRNHAGEDRPRHREPSAHTTSFDSKLTACCAVRKKFSPEEQRGLELFMTNTIRAGDNSAQIVFIATADRCSKARPSPITARTAHSKTAVAKRSRAKQRSRQVCHAPAPQHRTHCTLHARRAFPHTEEVVEHYSTGVVRTRRLIPISPNILTAACHSNPADKAALVVFSER